MINGYINEAYISYVHSFSQAAESLGPILGSPIWLKKGVIKLRLSKYRLYKFKLSKLTLSINNEAED